MKKLINFYSFEGNTKLIAEKIAKTIDEDILELKPKKEIKTKNFMKFFWGGRQAIMNEKPSLLPLNINPDEYDIVFIGQIDFRDPLKRKTEENVGKVVEWAESVIAL